MHRPSISVGFALGLALGSPALAQQVVYLGDYNGVAFDPALAGPPDTVIELSAGFTSTSPCEGYALALTCDDSLGFVPGFDWTGTILETVGIEYVESYVDDDLLDGDGHEFIVGLIIDYVPPFLGQTVRATAIPLELGRFTVEIAPSAPVGSTLVIEYVDEATVAALPDPVGTYLVQGGLAILPTLSFATVTILPGPFPQFRRGDCNVDGALDIADVIALLDALFTPGTPPAECEGACEANSDGQMDIADAVYLLGFLFSSGPPPGPPFPDCGLFPQSCDSFDACP